MQITAFSVGSSVTSPLITVIFGSEVTMRVTSSENSVRLTASAPPAGTAVFSAAAQITEPKRRISSFSRPQALSTRAALSEFEQTSSAKPLYLWAGEYFCGFIS